MLVGVALAISGAAPRRHAGGRRRPGAAGLGRVEPLLVLEGRAAVVRRPPGRGRRLGRLRVEWRRERKVADPAQDAHSLYIETAAELGLVGLLLLALAIAGVAMARRLRRERHGRGPIAALVVWAVHAGIDWDWEMPALTLVALLIAGALSGRAEPAG